MLKVFSSALFGVAMMAAATAHAELRLSDAWLRAVPPVSPSMAGYVVATNTGDTPVVITGAHSDIAGHIMLHDMSMQEDGTRKMRHVHQVEVPAGGSVSFAPGGMHLMLMHLARVPGEGESVSICLEQEGKSPVCSKFRVARSSPFGH